MVLSELLAHLQALLGMGAGVNARDKSGGTPLSVTAEEQGRARAAAALLAAGADARAKNTAGEAPLYIAALRGRYDLVQLLLAHHEHHGIAWTVSALAACPGASIFRRQQTSHCYSPCQQTSPHIMSDDQYHAFMWCSLLFGAAHWA